MRKWLVLLFSLYGSLVTAAELNPCKTNHCMIIVDAGSTGSRMHLYAYEFNVNREPIHVKDVASKKIHPGFATIELSQTAINQYLDRLFEHAPKASVPVYFYATAGMRIVPLHKQHLYFKYLKQWFSHQASLKLIEAKTITGTEEGIYGWLAVNYRLGVLQSNKPLVGVMDTGGASVQIVFPVNNKTQIARKNLLKIAIYNRDIDLFVYSFLGLGQTEMSHQFLDEKFCFAKDYPLPSGEVGKGDITQCQNRISTLINKLHHVDQIVQPITRTNPIKRWYAIGRLSELVQDHPLTFKNHQFTPKALSEQTNTRSCNKTWTVINHEYSGDLSFGNCLSAAYFYSLLVNGYGISPTIPINYFPQQDKNNNWTLGVVLHH